MEKNSKSNLNLISLTLQTLNLIEYLLKNGSPRCIHEFKDEIYTLRSLQDYYFVEGDIDRGVASKFFNIDYFN